MYSGASAPSISVVIPTLNEEKSLPLLLDDLAAQTIRPIEVLIIDGGSEDGTKAIALSDERLVIRVLENPAMRVPNALNIGLKEATGDVVVRVDGHSRLNSYYLEVIATNFELDPFLGGVGGVKLASARTWVGSTIARVLSSKWAVGGSRYHYAEKPEMVDHIPFGSYPRQVLSAVGGWDEELAVNQDFELDYRLRQRGFRLLLDPEARILWQCRESIPRLFRQYYRYGQGKAAVVRKHPGSAKPRQLMPPLVVLAVVAALVCSVVVSSPEPLVVPGIYLVTVLTVARIIRGVGWARWLVAAAALLAMQGGFGLGFLKVTCQQVFTGRFSVTGSQSTPFARPGR